MRNRHHSGIARRLLLGSAVLLLGAGCAAPGSDGASGTASISSPSPAKTATVQDTVNCATAVVWNSNPSDPAQLRKGRVPAGFSPVEAVRCTWSLPNLPTDATTAPPPVITMDYFSGDFAPLLAALAEPNGPSQNISCPEYAEVLPELWLVNAAAQAVNVHWPVDACGISKPGTAKAIMGLTLERSTTNDTKGGGS